MHEGVTQPVVTGGFGAGSFLPADYVQRKAELRNNIILLSTFALVMGGVGAAFFKTQQDWRTLREIYTDTTAQYLAEGEKIEQLKQLDAQRAAMMSKAEITASLIEKVPRHALIGELSLRMPEGMWLTTLELKSVREEAVVVRPPNAGGPTTLAAQAAAQQTAVQQVAPRFTCELTFTGNAKNNNDVADYLASLKGSPVLEYVDLAFIRDATVEGESMRSFEMSARLRTDVTQDQLQQSIQSLMASKGQVARSGAEGGE